MRLEVRGKPILDEDLDLVEAGLDEVLREYRKASLPRADLAGLGLRPE